MNNLNKIVAILLLVLLEPLTMVAQKTVVSLEEAMQIALKNYPKLKQLQLEVDKEMLLQDAAKGHNPTGFGYMADEVDFSSNQGVHGFYVQQQFNLPTIANAKAQLQAEKVKERQLYKALTEKRLLNQVTITYQQILYIKSQLKLHKELKAIYSEFERVASQKMEVGETGQLPVLAAQTALKQLQMQLDKSKQLLPIQVVQLQHWLLNENIEGVTDTQLVALVMDTTNRDFSAHPTVQVLQQEINIQKAKKETIKSRLSPKISTALRFQVVDGQLPYMGGQLGVNVPLFTKGIKTQMQAVDLDVAIQKERIDWQKRELEHHQHQLRLQIELHQEQLRQMRTEIFPAMEKQVALSKKAYELGELDYVYYLQQVRTLAETKYQYLDDLLRFNEHILEYQFLLGS